MNPSSLHASGDRRRPAEEQDAGRRDFLKKAGTLPVAMMAAGRLSDRRGWVERAFRDTFNSIKPNDAAIVGIYDRYNDQPAENAAPVRRLTAGKPAG